LLVLTWNDLVEAMEKLPSNLQEELEAVIGIGRSGLIPAALACKKLNCRKFLVIIISKYGEGKPPKKLYDHPVVIWGFSEQLNGGTVLIVDDIAVTGETLKLAEEYAKEKGAGKALKFALVKRPSVSIDFYGWEYEHCVIFPWE